MHHRRLLVPLAATALVLGGAVTQALGQSTRSDGKPASTNAAPAKAKRPAAAPKTEPKRELSPEERKKADEQRQVRLTRIRAKLDANRDGVISEVEWRAASDEWRDFDKEFDVTLSRLDAQARRALIRSLDTDGDGVVSPEERAAMRQRVERSRLEMIERFDADGDGKLSGEERRALARALEDAKQRPARPAGRPGEERSKADPAPREGSSSRK